MAEPKCKCFIGLATGLPHLCVVDAGGGPDQDKPANRIGSGQGSMERDTATHRITDIDGLTAHVDQEATGRVQVGIVIFGTGTAVAGKINRHHLMVGRQITGQRPPAAGVLREAVGQHEPWPSPPYLVLQTHPPSMPNHGADADHHGAARVPIVGHGTGTLRAMTTSDAATFCATLVDEWVRAGVATAFVAPGSRSTPLALALSANEAMTLHVFHDERAASFAALGHGLATSLPAVLLCTSGTAATHFHGAVVEADLSSVPLLVCTADRPPELWDIGAPQTIDQSGLYGSAVRYFAEPGVPDAAAADSWRSLASRAIAEAVGWSGRCGPVHLNLSFRDPLVAEPGPLPPGRPGAKPWHQVTAGRASDRTTTAEITPPVADVASRLWSTGAGNEPAAVEGVIVAGAGSPQPEQIVALAEQLGWPILADHRSKCRAGGNAITYFDALLRSPAFTSGLKPELVLRFGEGLASKALTQWLSGISTSAEVVAVVDGTRWSDPERIAATMLQGPSVVSGLLSALPDGLRPSAAAGHWTDADQRSTDVVARLLAPSVDQPAGANEAACASEIEIARSVVAGIPSGGALVLSSSMPVRDVEWYGPNRDDIDVYANRGANGIDGVISTAIGVALTGRPTTVLIGDVAFLHDSTALIALATRTIDLHIVVVDNDGGAIFSFLPQARQLDHDTYEQLFGTPHDTDLAALAKAHKLATRTFTSTPPTEGGVTVSLAASNRETNARVHDRLNQAVSAALSDALGVGD